MENPVEREAKFEDRMNRMQTNCRRIKKDWATPNRTDGFWQAPAAAAANDAFKERGYVKTSVGMGTPRPSAQTAAWIQQVEEEGRVGLPDVGSPGMMVPYMAWRAVGLRPLACHAAAAV